MNTTSSYYEITTFFPNLISNFLYSRCNQNKCKLTEYWNNTDLDLLFQQVSSSNYLKTISYLLFPLVLLAFLILATFSIFNCLYLNCCFCCCLKPAINSKSENFIYSLIGFIAIFSIASFIISLLCQVLVSKIEMFGGYLMCSVINTNVFALLNANNYTETSFDDWKGLLSLNLIYKNEIKNEIKQFQIKDIGNDYNVYLSSLETEYLNLLYNINKFQSNFIASDFIKTSPNLYNNDEMTYTCKRCDIRENLTNLGKID